MPEDSTRFVSLSMTQRMVPDDAHYDSTVESVEAITGAGEDDRVWLLEKTAVASVDPYQLIDDAEDEFGLSKMEGIRAVLRAGDVLPPVYAIHQPDKEYPYNLIEGRHRYNAAYAEGAELLAAWTAHLSCSCRTDYIREVGA